MDGIKRILRVAKADRIRDESRLILLDQQIAALKELLQLEEDVKENQKVAVVELLHLLPSAQCPLIIEDEDNQSWYGSKEVASVVIENQPKKVPVLQRILLKKAHGNADKGAEDKEPLLDTVIVEKPTMYLQKENGKQIVKGSESNGEVSFTEAGRRICNGTLECFILLFICLIGD